MRISEMPSSTDVRNVVPLHEEAMDVSHQTLTTGRVRIKTVTSTRDEHVNEMVTTHEAQVERVPIGRFIDLAPPIREDGDVTIISLVEEVIVIERRLFLREEVRIRRVSITKLHQETVALRRQDAVIQREAFDDAGAVTVAAQSDQGDDK
jgi:stress response protein YsnF